MQKKMDNKSSKAVKVAVIGAGLAAVAAGAYFFFGPKGKKHQKNVKAWAIKMKGDVVEKLEKAREISEPVYHNIIDTVASQYAKKMKVGRAEVNELAADLKKHWKTISKAVHAPKKKVI